MSNTTRQLFQRLRNKFRSGTIVTLSQLNARQCRNERQLRHFEFTTKIENHCIESLRIAFRKSQFLRILLALHPEHSHQRAVLRRFTSTPNGRLVQIAVLLPSRKRRAANGTGDQPNRDFLINNVQHPASKTDARPNAIPRACFVKRIDRRNPLAGLVETENSRVSRPTSQFAPPNHVGLPHQQIDMAVFLSCPERDWQVKQQNNDGTECDADHGVIT